MKKAILRFVILAVAAVSTANAQSDTNSQRVRCVALENEFVLENVRIVSARISDKDILHCEVIGAIDERVGVDGQPYAIRFRIRIPVGPNWNGRFLFSGGGGTNGTVGQALSAAGVPFSALQAGYAVGQNGHHTTCLVADPASE